MTKITYRVSWQETWCRNDREFKDIEQAKEWAIMQKAMCYKDVKIERIEATEIEI